MYLSDRHEAGRRLVEHLRHLAGQSPLVLGLPRGGVPVAAEVARALGAPLDVIMARKLTVPGQDELTMGAIGENGARVVNDAVLHATDTTEAQWDQVEAVERMDLRRRAGLYRSGREAVPLAGRLAIIVDDGLHTGSTARAACLAARAGGAGRIVLAVPVAPRGWTTRLADVADELVCLDTPHEFTGIDQFYGDFAPTTDEDVVGYLRAATRRGLEQRLRSPSTTSPSPPPTVQGTDVQGTDVQRTDPEVTVQAGSVPLGGSLALPDGASGIVVFAHGSGSSRHSPRNRFVAEQLNRAGLATLLFDLLTDAEAADRANVFDTGLLAGRLLSATDWLSTRPDTRDLAVGYFGASTGAAAALLAAAAPGCPARAVVSRGGRPDLAMPALPQVMAPTLLIVGGADTTVLDLNRQAKVRLGGPSRLDVIPGATHLFEEPGTLETVAQLAAEWFTEHLGQATSP